MTYSRAVLRLPCLTLGSLVRVAQIYVSSGREELNIDPPQMFCTLSRRDGVRSYNTLRRHRRMLIRSRLSRTIRNVLTRAKSSAVAEGTMARLTLAHTLYMNDLS